MSIKAATIGRGLAGGIIGGGQLSEKLQIAVRGLISQLVSGTVCELACRL